jgi:hypothetical protein
MADPSDRIQKAFERICAQREEILEAFGAKYLCTPESIVQVQQTTADGIRWWVERRNAAEVQSLADAQRTPENYRRLTALASLDAGPGGPEWNGAYALALEQRGLRLQQARPAGDQDEWYPHGAPLRAPLPYPEGEVHWPEETLIVWADASAA